MDLLRLRSGVLLGVCGEGGTGESCLGGGERPLATVLCRNGFSLRSSITGANDRVDEALLARVAASWAVFERVWRGSAGSDASRRCLGMMVKEGGRRYGCRARRLVPACRDSSFRKPPLAVGSSCKVERVGCVSSKSKVDSLGGPDTGGTCPRWWGKVCKR